MFDLLNHLAIFGVSFVIAALFTLESKKREYMPLLKVCKELTIDSLIVFALAEIVSWACYQLAFEWVTS